MSKEQERPDGYVAWHSEQGREIKGQYFTYTMNCQKSEAEAWEELVGVRCSSKNPKQIISATLELIAEGWKIRPVKLLFLDEGKCKKE